MDAYILDESHFLCIYLKDIVGIIFINQQKGLFEIVQTEDTKLLNEINLQNSQKFIDFKCINIDKIPKDDCRNFLLLNQNGNIFFLEIIFDELQSKAQ